MSSRKRNAPHANRVQRRGTNLNDVIIISDDESEDGVVADSPKYNPVTPRRRSKRPILSDTQNSNIRGCWPVKKRKSVLQGQSSNSTNHLHDSTSTKNSMDHCRHIFLIISHSHQLMPFRNLCISLNIDWKPHITNLYYLI